MSQRSTKVGTARSLIHFPSTTLLIAVGAFIVYGSLVPFDFQSVALDRVAEDFLRLGRPERALRSLTDWTTNVAIFVPLGFLALSVSRRGHGTATAIWSALFTLGGCIMLSVGIELAQNFFPARDSSALDVIANTIGAAVGIATWFALGDETIEAHKALVELQYSHRPPGLIGKLKVALSAGCGLLIAAWGGFFNASWTGWNGAIVRLDGIHVLPFVQHQAAAIGLATASTAFAMLAYAPLGALLWLLDIRGAQPLRARLVVTSIIGASVALLVEGAKLFLVTRKPDTGNIVIAGLAAGAGYFIAPLAANMLGHKHVATTAADSIEAHVAPVASSFGLLVGRAMALVNAIAACALVATYPIWQIPLGIALFGYTAILTRYPTVWLLVIPALLPVLDLAPWTGRFFLDEFDAFVLATLAVGLWRAAGRPLTAARGRLFWLLVACFIVSFLASTVLGLLPLQPWDANALASHYSHYAALRLAKGLAFAAGLAVLISSHAAAGHDVRRALGAGMILGLAAATASVVWERLAYAGLADFTQGFRATGLFSTMHTGGAHLDAYLVITLPFAAAWALRTRRPASRVAATLLFAASTYAVMMTFSRAAIAGLVIAILSIAAWVFLSGRRAAGRAVGSGVKATAGLALAGMVIAPVLLGSFMQSRLATTSTDLEVRTSHWNDAIDIMTDNWSTTLFGMGLGRYPETYLLLSREKDKPATHRFESEGNNTFLRVHQGAPLYVEQIVSVEPRRDYKVLLKARTRGRSAAVNVLLCDRTFLQGFGCQSVTLRLTGEAGKWQLLQGSLNSASVGENRLRITKFSLENAGSDSPVELDDVALIDPDGTDHLANGSFQAGADRWFFSTPFNHLSWHIKNLWLQVLFEQGWVGLLIFCALITATVARLAALAWRGEHFAAALLAAMVGFLAVGAFDSLFDAPRLTLMFGLLVAATGISYARPAAVASKFFSQRAAEKPSAPMIELPSAGAFAGTSAAITPVRGTPMPPEWRKTILRLLAGVLMLAAAIAAVTQLPFVPYNVHLLGNRYHPITAPILLAAFCFWAFGLPVAIAWWLGVAQGRGAAYPLVVAGHGLIGWAMVHLAVLPDAVHKMIGSPQLNWPWEAENIARFVPLFSVLSMQLTAGAMLAAALTGSRIAKALVWWLLCAAMLLPLQYWVIVSQAATDNLTELMAENAGIGAFLLLSSYLMLVGTTGSLLATMRSGAGGPRRAALALTTLVLSLPLGYFLLTAGTEANIIKYETTFSGLQFILSSDRSHYANPPELWVRFAVAHLAAVGVTALTQFSLWAGFHERVRGRSMPLVRSRFRRSQRAGRD